MRTRAVLEHVADGIVTVSDDGVIESFNRAAVELFGYGEEEVIGQSFALMIASSCHADSSDDELRPRSLLTQRRPGRPPIESFGRRKDGSTLPDGART